MLEDIQTILIDETTLQNRVRQLAQQLAEEYADKDPVFIGVLKGVVSFFGDFIQYFDAHCQIDFMWISSYSGAESSGKIQLKKDVSTDLKGRHVVILEDIFDTGASLDYTYHHLLSKEPASLKICTLLDKPERRKPEITLQADYVGFTVPDAFVVGYGLDYNEHYRNLPYIGILKSEVYSK